MDELPDDWEDNVAAPFTEMLSEPVLDMIAGDSYGRTMLTVLYEAMITGSVSDFERQQSDRIILAKTRQMKPEDFLESQKYRPSGQRTEIFPVRFMRITPGYDDAPLMAELTGEGKIRVEYPTRVKYASKFAAEVATLPDEAFLSSGQSLSPSEIVGITDYESGGATIYRPALVLIDYSNRVKHSTLGKIAQVSIAAATLGIGGPAVGAGEAGAEQAGVWAARLALADKIDAATENLAHEIEEARASQPEVFAEDKPEIADTASPSAELNVLGPHPFFQGLPCERQFFARSGCASRRDSLASTGTTNRFRQRRWDVSPQTAADQMQMAAKTAKKPKLRSVPATRQTLPARKNAPPLGQSQIKAKLQAKGDFDLAVQKHKVKTDFREAPGVAVQSAHMLPSSVMRDIEDYSRSDAVTILMPRDLHTKFDNVWKAWARNEVAAGKTSVTVEKFLRVLDDAAEAIPELRGRTSDTMSWLFRAEVYSRLGLSPTDLLRLPWS